MNKEQFAVSNIAWSPEDDTEVHDYLLSRGISGVEMAPTAVWGPWIDIDLAKVEAYRKDLNQKGLTVPAMQAIFFGCDFSIFNRDQWSDIHTHLETVCCVANALNAKVLVFGAPKLRARGGLNYFDAFEMATELFESLGDLVHSYDCVIGLEPNPVGYGCDFLTNVGDVISLVSRLETQGTQLHIDTGAISMTSDTLIPEMFTTSPVHFHVSAPQLDPVSNENNQFATIKQVLAKVNYNNWVSMEMKNPGSLEQLKQSVDAFASGLLA